MRRMTGAKSTRKLWGVPLIGSVCFREDPVPLVDYRALRTLASSVAFAFVIVACDQRSTSSAAALGDVPVYLRPAFHSLDSLLTAQQRDSLRALSLDSGFGYRNHRLADVIKPLGDRWMHSSVGDTVIGHGEKSYVTGSIVLDLYQQHLHHEPLDFAGALRRISPAYVDSIIPHTVSVDSVFLRGDLDASNVPDQLVREVRRQPIEVDAANG